ncbi:antibiotic ABC transporter ATP-binding protein [Tetragenococcus halophilus subsp. flandriensis]|uniref:lantibiotic protection ABC transporter ATP-binding protein n=1 Tax=Tetragenococcus halophilus TaxID=51669 RepID=UPI0023E9DF78|nr:lantibiotic protection ABC transporter ATP-binding protein [Tetragenococcus halophilus]GMA08597.1 antibiotic ABC transporter ATP-binding protein [Tetragenococcus halophilus subsp. flandriensis]
MKNIIETKQLTKTFKRETVLENISIHVQENTIYGLLGPNGAGKSTLLKLLTGIFKPNAGQIYYQEEPWQSKNLKEIGAMIEGPAIYPNLTARENLKVLATLLNIHSDKIEQVLQTVDLKNTGNKIVRHFSLGMKQRLGIAMALLNDPKLLILDEPTNGLDPLGIQELRELIRSFPGQGISVILSSHILSEVQQIADTVGILHNGQLGYEDKNDKQEAHLEKLFMDIVKREGE